MHVLWKDGVKIRTLEVVGFGLLKVLSWESMESVVGVAACGKGLASP